MLNVRPESNGKFSTGIFYPQNASKVIKLNDKGGLFFRSSWERKVMVFLDTNVNVVRWGAEFIEIQYLDINGHSHRYYPDFYAEFRTDDPHTYKRMVMEVKPYKETIKPQPPKATTHKALQSYEYAIKMYFKNCYKWQKAIEYCKNRGLEFFIITEKNLNI